MGNLRLVTCCPPSPHVPGNSQAILAPPVSDTDATTQSSGDFLCILDSDDVMDPRRIQCQLALATAHPEAMVGCNFYRTPPGSTERYARWANGLDERQLTTHRFRDCTIIQPTWFYARQVFERQEGGYDKQPAEDLFFLLRHWDEHVRSGAAARGRPAYVKCPEALLMYRFRPGQATFSVPRSRLREVRVRALERQVLSTPPWCEGFSIWGGGKDGRAFYRELQPEYQRLVTAFYDVDEKKVGPMYDSLARRCPRFPPSQCAWQQIGPQR